jgi:outer membrane protein OmpA-like peptidoglycan-associated protein
MGLGDVYVSRRVADDWRYWSRPEMIGSSVNSPGFEADVSLSADGRWLYTGRVDFNEPHSQGRADLYRNRLPDTIRSNITITSVGQLIDAVTGRGIQGEVQFVLQRENLDLGKVKTTSTGEFSILIMPGAVFKVIGTAPGYQTSGVIFDTRHTRTIDPPKHVRVALQKGGTSTQTDHLTDIRVLFPTGSDRLDRTARADLRRFANAWPAGGSPPIILHAFTDSVGTTEANMGLAQRRAEAVAAELRRLGIPSDRVSLQARGEATTAGPGEDAGTLRLNRRVDVRVE